MSPENSNLPEVPGIISELPLGQAIPWKVVLQGKEFSGEIVRVDRWQEQATGFGNGGDAFRIVVFTSLQDALPQVVGDPRVVYCLPGRLTYSLEERVQEYRSIRERKAGYAGRKEGGSLAREETQLARKLAREETELFRSGRILAYPPLIISSEQVFSLPDNRERFDFIARSVCQHWDKLLPILPGILAAKSYLSGAKLREGDAEMAMDRLSLLEQMAFDNLLSHPHLWPSLKALFDWFQSRYVSIYLAHHAHFHQELSLLHSQLEKAAARLEALRRLNSIVRLGEPLGVELFAEHEKLLSSTTPCPLGQKVEVETTPLCPGCGLSLTAQAPRGQTDIFLERLEQALSQQLSRLSSEAIRQILARGQEERIDQFIKIVQASDLSALVSVLDDEMARFIRLLLAEGQPAR